MQRLSSKTRIFNSLRYFLILTKLDHLLPWLTIGRAPSHFLARLAPNNYQYPVTTLRSATREGIHYLLDISQFMEWFLYFGVGVEPRKALLHLAQEGDIVIDIGANIGETALKFSRKIGSKGKVIGFEPHPTAFERCSSNLKLNPELSANIKVYPTGLGDSIGSFAMNANCKTNLGGAKIMREVSSETHTVSVTTLDAFVEKDPLPKVDLIKIDVEGFEMKVLLGAKKTLQKFHPKLFIEINDSNLKEQGSSAKEVIEFLESFQYKISHAISGESFHSKAIPQSHCDIYCQ